MLVLTRKSNQSIMIADDVEISVLSIVGDKVRIGIEAPKNIPIFRKEVYLQIQRKQAEQRAESPEATPEAVDAALGEIANGG
jgi:carbon storage regulator